MLSMKRLRRWRDLQLLRWQSHLRGAFCHAFKTTNRSSKQTIIRSLLKEKRSRSCLTAEAECHHLGSSPYAPLAAPGLPLYTHRTERLRASLVGSLRVFIQRTSETPGKTMAIAAGTSKSTDFPHGQSGTGRLSFRLRKLQLNAKPPDFQCSLRSVKRQ